MGSIIEIVEKDQLAFNHAALNVRIGMMKLMEMSFGLSVPARLNKSGGNTVYTSGFASPELGVKITMKEKEEAVWQWHSSDRQA